MVKNHLSGTASLSPFYNTPVELPEDEKAQLFKEHMARERPLRERQLEFARSEWRLQHQDGITNGFDCTRSLPVALWFACQPVVDAVGWPKAEDRDGAVIALYPPRQTDLENPSPSLEGPDDPRYSAQYAVLLPLNNGCLSRHRTERTWRVPAGHKAPLLNYLRAMHSITAESLFPDIQGAVQSQKSRLRGIY